MHRRPMPEAAGLAFACSATARTIATSWSEARAYSPVAASTSAVNCSRASATTARPSSALEAKWK